jgi:acetyl esterase/lipase
MQTLSMWETVPGTYTEMPILQYYPTQDKKTDATIIIFPGGAYKFLDPEAGADYAGFLNTLGMDAFVCRYRVTPHFFPLPLLDARRAVRYVRTYAEKFGVNLQKIAVLGSSAGGHLAALLSNYTAPIPFENLDEVDKTDAMPNKVILSYPVICSPTQNGLSENPGVYENLLGKSQMSDAQKYAPDLLVSENTPPTFMWYTTEDVVNVINIYQYAIALQKYHIPHEMHVFCKGPHGLSIAKNMPYVAQWTKLLANWLIENGWLSGLSYSC